MGKIVPKQPAKLIAGFIFDDQAVYDQAKKLLERRFGIIDFESEALAFVYTKYYQYELGNNPKRRFISFKKLVKPAQLPQIKIITNHIEQKLAKSGRRQINIDPGYLELSKLILATTKDYNHRIYLDKGIFAEITLDYQKHTFRPWPWTYPDYQSQEYIEIFNRIRKIYHKQLS